MTKPFRHSAGFGKRIEHWIVGRMLKEAPAMTLLPPSGANLGLVAARRPAIV